jgi:DNA invertase Pin-like site-specific DNA recombinase
MKKNDVVIMVRVSKEIQDYSRQIDDLQKVAKQRNWNVVEIITEKISGASALEDREGIKKVIQGATAGKFQKVLISEISRIGRTTLDTLSVLDQLNKLKISVYVQDLNIETLDDDGKINFQAEMLLHMLSLFASRERSTLISRIRSGIDRARFLGKIIGRPHGTEESIDNFLKKHKSATLSIELGLSIRKVAKLHEISTTTVQKIKRALVERVAA